MNKNYELNEVPEVSKEILHALKGKKLLFYGESGTGKTTWINVVVACKPCNMKKGSRTAREANMRLSKKPLRPDFSFQVSVVSNQVRISFCQLLAAFCLTVF